jgi:hypothetical protein
MPNGPTARTTPATTTVTTRPTTPIFKIDGDETILALLNVTKHVWSKDTFQNLAKLHRKLVTPILGFRNHQSQTTQGVSIHVSIWMIAYKPIRPKG